MFGKLMSLSDDVMRAYYPLVSGLSPAEVAAVEAALQDGRLHPMEAKKRLARTVTAMYHGEAAAAAAEAGFAKVVQGREVPENIEIVSMATPDDGEPAWKVVVWSGTVASNSEARRLIQQGAVEVDGRRVTDPNQRVPVSSERRLLQVGKRKFRRFVLEKE
jgi:tyrosyl-tRNA synthetase